MDVTCERCSTEYEFDDALVSERGTTVKCTTCGHQFKVRRNDGVTAPERWVVRTVDGREIEFTALRDLQAAISHARVTRDDVLARGGARPRRLGSIAELEPFFAGAGGISVPSTTPGLSGLGGARSRQQTPQGLGAMLQNPTRTEGSVAIPLPAPPRGHRLAQEEASSRPQRRTPSIPPPPLTRTPSNPPPPIVVPGAARVEPMAATQVQFPPPPFARTPSSPPPAPPPPPSSEPATVPVISSQQSGRGALPPPVAEITAPQAPSLGATTLPRGTPERVMANVEAPERISISTPSSYTPTPSNVRASFTSEESAFSDPRLSIPATSRRTGGARLIIGVVVAGLVVFLGLTVGRKYITAEAKPTSNGPVDERVSTLLHDGDRSLTEGDLESANEQLVKASALAESDPRVAAALARLDAVRADQRWLRVRLLASGDADEAVAKRELDDALGRLKQATKRAVELAPTDPVVVRAQIDALRMSGDRDGARKLVGSLGTATSQPESALTLAAIDLTEDKPTYPAVIERLRAAAASERNLGRARGMLVYALARSGETTQAKVELGRLAEFSRPYPLANALQSYVARADKGVDPSSLPDVQGPDIPSDPKECLRLGKEARSKGDMKRADQLLSAALQKNPNDSEAATELAEVARKAKDTKRAQKLFEQAIKANGDNIAALAGLADLKWDGGDRSGAIALYKDIADKDPSGPYAPKAKERIGKNGGSAPSPPPPSGGGRRHEDATPDIAIPSPPPQGGHIDTSDLPGVKPPPKAPEPSGPPPGIDTSDLPGLK
jgi:predicted Zn finger-like uncharacterized protein